MIQYSVLAKVSDRSGHAGTSTGKGKFLLQEVSANNGKSVS